MGAIAAERTTLVAIDSVGGFHAEIDPFGAQLWRLRDSNGRDLLWDGDPAWWSGRAPVLFPIIGSLRDDCYIYRGETFSLPRHGFARKLLWQPTRHERESASFRLSADDETRKVYPFEFILELTFTVSGSSLAMAASVANAGSSVMPFSFGFHPALRWPFAGGARGDYRIRLDREEPEPLLRLDRSGLVAGHAPSPVRGFTFPLADELFADDALIFNRLRSDGLVFGIPGAERLRVDFPAFPDLGLWTVPGAGFLCIEPWLGRADPVEPYGEIFAKPGICTLQPGQRWQATMTLTLDRRIA